MHRTRAVTASASPTFRRALRVASALVVAGIAAGVSLPAAAQDKPAQNKPAAAKPAKAQQAKAKPAKAPAGPKVCYSRSEHAAEQLIRMHTEMMITGLTCKEVVPEKTPFAKYQEFTVKHRPTISKAESELMSHFRRTGKGNSTSKFDTYRTEVANEVSRRASIIGIENYCQTFVPRIEQALTLTPDEVRTLTADEKNAGLMHLSQQPLCDVQVVSGPDAAPVVASTEPPRGKSSAGGKPTPAKAAKPAAPAKPAAKSAKTAASPAEAAPQTASAEARR